MQEVFYETYGFFCRTPHPRIASNPAVPPPQHARTGKLYFTELPLQQLIEMKSLDILSIVSRRWIKDFGKTLRRVLNQKDLPQEQSCREIYRTLNTLVDRCNAHEDRHLFLASDLLVLKWGKELFTLPLEAESIKRVLTWQDKISQLTP